MSKYIIHSNCIPTNCPGDLTVMSCRFVRHTGFVPLTRGESWVQTALDFRVRPCSRMTYRSKYIDMFRILKFIVPVKKRAKCSPYLCPHQASPQNRSTKSAVQFRGLLLASKGSTLIDLVFLSRLSWTSWSWLVEKHVETPGNMEWPISDDSHPNLETSLE